MAVSAGAVAAATSSASSPPPSSPVSVYEWKRTGLNIDLGPKSSPTTLASLSVPAGSYLVTGSIGVNTQPGSFIVCSLSNIVNGNDGVFGVFTNQWTQAAQENVRESELITVRGTQRIHLTCDDNQGMSGDTVGEVVVDALPEAAS